MKLLSKKLFLTLISLFVISVVLWAISGCISSVKKETPLRLGWQPPWANQGQIVEVFKHSDVLTKNEVIIDYKPFSYGGPMTEAALAGQLDVFFSGDQPAITLISRDPNWRIIARMVNYRSAILVPLSSPLKTLNDLVGKKVGAAFGSTTYRDVVRIFRDAGLEKEITLVNVDQAEQAGLISKGGPGNWSGLDAIATYDPTIAISVYQNNARILKDWVSPSVVVASEDVIKNKPDALKNFLKAYTNAFAIYSQNPSVFNKFYSDESGLTLPDQVYSEMAQMEPNLSAKMNGDVNILIDSTLGKIYQNNADVALSIGIIEKPLNISDYVDMRFAKEAMQETK